MGMLTIKLQEEYVKKWSLKVKCDKLEQKIFDELKIKAVQNKVLKPVKKKKNCKVKSNFVS